MTTTRRIRITVRGDLGPHLETFFDGLTISRSPGRTDLVGDVADQAQLHGQLARIRDLGLELAAVQVLDAGDGAERPDVEARP